VVWLVDHSGHQAVDVVGDILGDGVFDQHVEPSPLVVGAGQLAATAQLDDEGIVLDGRRGSIRHDERLRRPGGYVNVNVERGRRQW
jgi:hypothetical protein